MPATHIIINHTYLYPGTRLFHQDITHQAPDGIVLKDIEFHVDMLRCFPQFAQQGLQHGEPQGIGFHPVSIEGESLVGITEQGYETTVIDGKRT